MFQHVVDAQNGDAALRGQRGGGERCGQSLPWISGATRGAQETFAAEACHDWKFTRGDFIYAAQ